MTITVLNGNWLKNINANNRHVKKLNLQTCGLKRPEKSEMIDLLVFPPTFLFFYIL